MKGFQQVLLLVSVICSIGYGQVSDQELLDISSALWDGDTNSMKDAVSYNEDGVVLFDSVDETRLSQGTYGRFQALREFYVPEIGIPDNCGSGTSCYQAQESLLDLVMTSHPITTVHPFLASKGLADSSISGFRSEIRQYFFQEFSRSGGAALDSSGFEHAFLGEVRNQNEITGFHGWIQAYLLERDGDFSLNAYEQTCQPDVGRTGFDWNYGGNTYTKSVSSISIGNSIEAELALYTLCFLARPNASCRVSLEGNSRAVQTYTMSNVSPTTVGTSYISC
ncbi:hypothetical protein CAPTEDRAFT_219138 [Capitella teleta]|uniref:Uridylate-specific endoribonuclease n=1 Tax=Capitella teleta TaxID=283909 RepID=R7UK40_CAPTE|nr:hypothetical protein CAPTEDRAFT_219138 [Capitella teleta]|eukprot:ELU03647.1 hypothetical protein CAPTEDRAFT_219138 [Capitella teleta]